MLVTAIDAEPATCYPINLYSIPVTRNPQIANPPLYVISSIAMSSCY